jgi:short-subunit dehydrogenase
MKYIFITGVSTGIGYHALKTCVDKGYHVIGSVRKEADATKLRNEFKDKATFLIFDVQDKEATAREITSIYHLLETAGLFALINNAGVAVPGPLQYLTEEEFVMQMDVNVYAVRRITNLLLPYLGTNPKYTAGKIINISSVSGLFNSPFNGAYCISKHALESMTDIYRRELLQFGIQVVAIEPGPIKSEIWSKNKGKLDKFLDTEYRQILEKADKIIEKSEKSALDTHVISDTILKILDSTDPKTRYLIHRKKWLFKMLAHYLPDKWVDKLIAKSMMKKDKFRPV